MPTIRLIPSAYSVSNSSYVTFSDTSHPASNMYANTDSTTYATIRGRNSSNTSRIYYCFIHGFNFDDVPSNASVTSFSIKIKCYRNSYQRTGETYRPKLASSTSNSNVISNTTLASDLTTSAATYTFPTNNLSWNTLKNYGSSFSIEIVLNPSSNQYPYVYVYGAEIEVNYTMPTAYNVTASTTSGTISPSGTVEVYEGSSYTLTISDIAAPIVTDNNVDVSSQLVQLTSGTETLVPNDYNNSGFTLTNISNAYTDSSSTTSATLNLAARTTGDLYLDLGGATIPSSATIQSVSCTATLQFSRNNSSSSVTASFQLYSGTTAKGSATNWISSATDVGKTTYTLTTGTWTASEIANARFYLTSYNGASGTQRIYYIYGVSFNVTYEFEGTVYSYTINNVQGNHTITVSAGQVTTKIYFKNNNTWTAASKVYKKVNGSWVQQSSLSSVFDSNTNYLKG